MRIAVVDIGSNSTRLFIANTKGGRVEQELERRTTVTRLGAGVDSNGHLQDEAMERVYAALQDYRELIDSHHPDRAVAILTSAVRDAANGEEFARTVGDRYGLDPHVLTGDEEARLTFLGAVSDRDHGDVAPTLVVDIGGGSTELVVGAGAEITFHVSTQAGVVRQSERHLHHDPPTEEERRELAGDVETLIQKAVPRQQLRAPERMIAVAGTATSLAAIAQELEPYDPEKVHGYVIGREECARILDRLAALPLDERRQVTGLHPDRAPTIVAGILILLVVLRMFALTAVEVSENDILRGAALEFGCGAG
ncbi:MAG TPA: Ppx/GppA phosphatase family protein [Solirubrobacteraceae bacterium]|jgi:exopolyphosphatase/guanosine-5'-triphosphate,3'-diphosphate pyrophosphatase